MGKESKPWVLRKDPVASMQWLESGQGRQADVNQNLGSAVVELCVPGQVI